MLKLLQALSYNLLTKFRLLHTNVRLAARARMDYRPRGIYAVRNKAAAETATDASQTTASHVGLGDSLAFYGSGDVTLAKRACHSHRTAVAR